MTGGSYPLVPTRPLDPGPHRRIGNVAEVPSHKIVDTIRNGDGDVGGVHRGVRRNRARSNEFARQLLRLFARIEKRHAIEPHQPGTSGIRISLPGFANHKLRSGEVKSVPGGTPPLASHLLTGHDHDIPICQRGGDMEWRKH